MRRNGVRCARHRIHGVNAPPCWMWRRAAPCVNYCPVLRHVAVRCVLVWSRSGRVRKNNSITRIPARRLPVQSGCGTFYTRLWTLGRLYQSLPNYRTSWRHIVTRCGEFTPSCGVSLCYDTIRNAILTCTEKQREFYCPPQ